jgi:hypothetical protein
LIIYLLLKREGKILVKKSLAKISIKAGNNERNYWPI